MRDESGEACFILSDPEGLHGPKRGDGGGSLAEPQGNANLPFSPQPSSFWRFAAFWYNSRL